MCYVQRVEEYMCMRETEGERDQLMDYELAVITNTFFAYNQYCILCQKCYMLAAIPLSFLIDLNL